MSTFLIDGAELTDDDLGTLAQRVADIVSFNVVVGIPKSGLRFADKLRQFCDPLAKHTLVVDDILTGADSLLQEIKVQEQIATKVTGLVIFAKGKCPKNVVPLFQENFNSLINSNGDI